MITVANGAIMRLQCLIYKLKKKNLPYTFKGKFIRLNFNFYHQGFKMTASDLKLGQSASLHECRSRAKFEDRELFFFF